MAHQIPLLGTARAVQRRSLHALLKGSSNSHSTSMTQTRGYKAVHERHGNANVYEHEHEHTHKYFAKPIEKYGYRTPFSLLSYSKTRLTAPAFPNNFIRRYSTAAPSDKKKRVAVVLSGCGVLDGSEIHESVSVLVHLSRAGVETKMFAPDIAQADVINHVEGSGAGETSRNVLVESARIARGKVKPLSTLQVDTFNAVIFPGGYGAAKNLCNFAQQGENLTVQSDVQRIIKEFHDAKKPIGMLCVSPVIVAKLIPGVSVTLGNEDKDIEGVIQKLGAKSVPLGVLEVAVDEENNIVSSPAYMTNSPIHKVFDGIGKFVETLLARTEPVVPTEQKKVEPKAEVKS